MQHRKLLLLVVAHFAVISVLFHSKQRYSEFEKFEEVGFGTCPSLFTNELGRDIKKDVGNYLTCLEATWNTSSLLKQYTIKTKHPLTISVLGDSRHRQLFIEIVRLVNGTANYRVESGRRDNWMFKAKKTDVTVKFYWAAFVDEYATAAVRSECQRHQDSPFQGSDFIILGNAAWTIRYRNVSLETLQEYKQNLTSFARMLPNVCSTRRKVIWALQDPVVEENLAPRRKVITNDWMDRFNEAAIQALRGSQAKIWRNGRIIAELAKDMPDGLHASDAVVRRQALTLLADLCSVKNGCC